jgi:hypothetical protein
MDPVQQTTPSASQNPSTYTRPSDPSQYIRTYAKDVAQLTNTAAPVSALSQPAPSAAPHTQSTTDGVTVTEYDASPINRSGDVSPKQFKQEVVDLSASDSDGIFAGKELAQAPAPLQGGLGSFGGGSLSAPAQQSEEEREAVLARLRAKVAERQQSAPPPQPVPPPTPELTIRDAAPVFTPPATPFPPIPPAPASQPVAPPPLPRELPKSETPSPLHTYSSDFRDRAGREGSSTFSVLAAQSDAGQSTRSPLPSPRRRSLLPLIAGAAMLLLGIGAATAAYLFTERSGIAPLMATVPSLIRYDEAVEVTGSGRELLGSVADVAAGGGVSGNVVVTYVTGGTATTSGSVPQPGGVLIRALSLPIPDILLRNIDQTSTVGVVTAGSETRPFMILKVNSYERTFAGMLAWERTIAQDLAPFYPPYAVSAPVSTSTPAATTTAPALFTDAIVSNYDVRILRDSAGRSVLLYGYRGKDMLLIARDEASFSTLITRLSTSGD